EGRPAQQVAEGARAAACEIGEAIAPEDVELIAQVPVLARVPLVAVEDLDARGRIVEFDARAVRQRQLVDQLERLRRAAGRGDDGAGELGAAGWRNRDAGGVNRIENAHTILAQVSGPGQRRGHGGQQRASVLTPRPLVVAEEEEFFLDDPPAERSAELI